MVEWKTIESLGNYFGGLTGKTKKDFENGNAKFITYMNVFSNPSLDVNTVGMVHINEGERQNKVQKGDILFSGSSETPDEAGMSCVVTDNLDGDYYMNSFCFGLRLIEPEQYNLHFFKHVLRSYAIRQAISKSASGVTRFNISKARFGKVLIPIPPLSEQNRIVGILDTFSESIENLKNQIAQRRKQYEHYRDQLFDLTKWEMVKIGDITKVFTCPRVYKNQWTNSGVPFWRSSDVISFSKGVSNPKGNVYISEELFNKLSKKNDKILSGDILVTGGGTIGIPYIKNDDSPLFVKDADLICIKKSPSLLTKFLYFYFDTSFFKSYLKKITHDATIAHYTINQIISTPVPKPPLSIQSNIVKILDSFETSISNLEAQLSLRQKQYEYYRNKLLTFE